MPFKSSPGCNPKRSKGFNCNYTFRRGTDFGGGWGWRGWGGGFGDGFGTATTTEETYKVGTLVVDLFDTNTKKLIWRGSASDTLSDKSDKNIKKFNSDVRRMFDHFPREVKK